jgi:hypothetical protein
MRQSPKRVVSVLLCLIVLSAVFLDYWSYSQTLYREPGIWMDVVRGTANAPMQYRVGVIDTAYFLARHTHLALRHTLTVLDVVSGFVAVFVLFLVLRRSEVYRGAGGAGEWFGAVSFVVLVQYYLAWLVWYQKPETLPTAAMLALALLLLTVRPALADGLGSMVRVIGLLLLVVAQAFVRADAAFALHVGILLVCLTPAGKEFALPRWLQAGTSLAGVGLAVGIQYWLMRRVYPQANYGKTQVLQLFLNLRSRETFIPFFLYLAPFAWTAAMITRRRYRIGPAEMAMFAAAVIFLGMWITVGRIAEVRLFLPFGLALAPLTVEIAMQWFLRDADGVEGV